MRGFRLGSGESTEVVQFCSGLSMIWLLLKYFEAQPLGFVQASLSDQGVRQAEFCFHEVRLQCERGLIFRNCGVRVTVPCEEIAQVKSKSRIIRYNR